MFETVVWNVVITRRLAELQGVTCHMGPATRHKWTRPALTPVRKLVLDLPIPEGWKAEWTYNRQCTGRESNSGYPDHESDALTTTLPSHLTGDWQVTWHFSLRSTLPWSESRDNSEFERKFLFKTCVMTDWTEQLHQHYYNASLSTIVKFVIRVTITHNNNKTSKLGLYIFHFNVISATF